MTQIVIVTDNVQKKFDIDGEDLIRKQEKLELKREREENHRKRSKNRKAERHFKYGRRTVIDLES